MSYIRERIKPSTNNVIKLEDFILMILIPIKIARYT